MSISKNALNSFANQYNVAVCTRAVYFRVADSQVNREILSLLYKEGLISGYCYNFEDVYLPEWEGILKKNELVFPMSRFKQQFVSPLPYYFNLRSVSFVASDALESKVVRPINNMYNSLQAYSYKNLNEFDYRESVSNLSNLFFFKSLVLFYQLYYNTNDGEVTTWYLFNKVEAFLIEPSVNIAVEDNVDDTSFFSFCKALLKLKSFNDDRIYIHDPISVTFSRKWEHKLISFLDHVFFYGMPFQEQRPFSRAKMQLRYAQDKWKFQDVEFEKDRIFVFPKYRFGFGVVKKMYVGGDTVVWKHLSHKEMLLKKSELGFSRFFVLTTSKGIMLDTTGDLFFKQGGLLLLILHL